MPSSRFCSAATTRTSTAQTSPRCTLNTSNVAVSTFGMVFKLPVDDNVYAQPLYVPNVAISGQGTHDVVYVATMSDSLYAFDADTGVQLWTVNFASSVGATPVPSPTSPSRATRTSSATSAS